MNGEYEFWHPVGVTFQKLDEVMFWREPQALKISLSTLNIPNYFLLAFIKYILVFKSHINFFFPPEGKRPIDVRLEISFAPKLESLWGHNEI